MRFSFRVIEKGRVRNGTIEAEDREQAIALLERKGLSVEGLSETTEDGEGKRSFTTVASVSMIMVGMLAVFWSAWRGPNTSLVREGEKTITFEINGSVQGDLDPTDRVRVLVPQLPARIERPWDEVGQKDGSFRITRELVTSKDSPDFFHLVIVDSSGRLRAEARRNIFDSKSGRGLVRPLEVH